MPLPTDKIVPKVDRVKAVDTYDVSRWKPLPLKEYASMLGTLFITTDEPDSLTTTCEQLPGGKLRLVTSARVFPAGLDSPPKDGVASVEPYLMVLYATDPAPGVSDALPFVRTDVQLDW